MKEKTLDIKTVCECNRCLGCETLHPQVSIINLENPNLEQDAVRFEFYAILLIEDCENECDCCGRKYYDYSNATMVFLTPGEVFGMSENNTLPDKGYLLAFHPDLLFRTSLKNHIENYTFFSYRKEEALHLSQRETAKVTCCLENIEDELHHAIDAHSSTILSRHIELLLDYCTRYYERQFITRENKNKAILEKMDKILDEYIASGKLQGGQLPTDAYCAGILNLSVAYFNDLLIFETGKTLTEYFQLKRLYIAKNLLLKTDSAPSAIACRLGYPSVQYFSLIFKKITGLAPNEYRCSQN
ncbi:helix-turn-helix transcriptional regulator [uncultured Parabacteroides sp.]|uniref:helix-turn-helix domain-containing protein n=1 Tax=uncultured Parabacteroides sp. TaxID=512312 RepID=UPI002803E964|nr:helix-turn-helix transcriptional regulator [uncultured Parabacteroides sp.]